MAENLRSLLIKEKGVIALGCYDAMSARIIEKAGFKVSYVSGNAVSRSLGFPDVGINT